MIRRIAALAIASAFTVCASSASAQSCTTRVGNLVQNCSFEDGAPNVTGSEYPNANVTGWTPLSGPQGGTFERWTNGFEGFAAEDGHSHLELQVNGPTVIQQVLGTTAGQSYALDFWSAHRPRDVGGYSKIDVYLNGSYLMTTGQISNPFSWQEFGGSFVGTGAETLEFRSKGNQESYGDFLDNVSVFADGDVGSQSVVPEPSSFALMGVGIALVGFMARRRRQVA
jgi:hypothetical protein